jgi:hypothetical protein
MKRNDPSFEPIGQHGAIHLQFRAAIRRPLGKPNWFIAGIVKDVGSMRLSEVDPIGWAPNRVE